jgi:hypothetical protein
MFALFNLKYFDTEERLGYYYLENDEYLFMGYTLKEAQQEYKNYKSNTRKEKLV